MEKEQTIRALKDLINSAQSSINSAKRLLSSLLPDEET